MAKTIGECLAQGIAFSAYLRVELTSGDVITRKAEIESRHTDGGLLAVTKTATVAKSDLTGNIRHVGFTDAEGGAEIIGARTDVTENDGGETAVALTATLTVPKPSGWQNCEALFDMLTGSIPFGGEWSALSDRGETVPVTLSAESNGIRLRAAFVGGLRRFTLRLDGVPALTVEAGGTAVKTGSPTMKNTDDLHFNDEVTEATVTSSRGDTGDVVLVQMPTSLGEERPAPLLPCKHMRSCGDRLLCVSDGEVRVYDGDLRLETVYVCPNLVDVSGTPSGLLAWTDGTVLRLYDRGELLLERQENATAVEVTENGGLRVRVSAGGWVKSYTVDKETGTAEKEFSYTSEALALIPRGASVILLEQTRMRLLSSAGKQITSRSFASYGAEDVVGFGEGLLIIRRANNSYYELFGRAMRIPRGKPVSADGRLYLTDYNGGRSLYAADYSTDTQLCMLDADDIAYAHGRLIYRRGKEMFFREALARKTVAVGENVFYTDTVSYTVTTVGGTSGACTAEIAVG